MREREEAGEGRGRAGISRSDFAGDLDGERDRHILCPTTVRPPLLMSLDGYITAISCSTRSALCSAQHLLSYLRPSQLHNTHKDEPFNRFRCPSQVSAGGS